MSHSSKKNNPLTRTCAKPTELCNEVEGGRKKNSLTKNAANCVGLIDGERRDFDQQLERDHVHQTLLREALLGVEDVGVGKVISVDKLRAKYGGR